MSSTNTRRDLVRSIATLSVASASGCIGTFGDEQSPTQSRDSSVRWFASVERDVSDVRTADGRIYASTSFAIYALDSTDGSEDWSVELYEPSDVSCFEGAFVLTTDSVYFGDCRRLRAVDAERGRDRWSVGDRASVYAPAIGDGVYYADGTVHALDAGGGSVRWSAEAGGAAAWRPALVDGMVVAGSTDGRLRAFDPASGARRWTTEVGARTTAPTAADGTVYVGGSADGKGFVAAVNAADGRTVWRSATPPVESAGFVGTAPTVVSDTVFVSFDDGTVRALRRDDGDERWRYEAEMPLSWLAFDGSLFVGTGDGLVILDPTDGSERRRYETRHPVDAIAPSDDAVAVGTGDEVQVFDRP